MPETTVNCMVLTRKLKARLNVLKKERAKTVARYQRDFMKWRRDLATFFRTTAAERCLGILQSDGAVYRLAGIPERVLQNAPKRPSLEEDPRKEIRKTLRFIAITEQKTMRVSDRDLVAWFGREKGEEEEEE